MLILNLYGNLLAVISIAALVVALTSPSAWRAVVATVVGVWSAYKSVAIARRLPSKVRLAEAILRRIKRSGYQQTYFKATCKDPCMRLMTRYIHWRTGHHHHVSAVISRYRKSTSLALVPSSDLLTQLVESGAVTDEQLQAAARKALDVAKA